VAQGALVAAHDARIAARVAPIEVRHLVDSDAIIDTFVMIVFSGPQWWIVCHMF